MNTETTAERPLVFVATYNESGNIEALCREILSLPVELSLLIVDDNSPDGTGLIADRIASSDDRVQVIHRPRKLGLGSAHKLAMSYAVRNGYQVLVTMDADFSHQPKDIPRLLAALHEADLVIGSRYMEGGRCDYTGYRKLLSWGANTFGRLLLGMPVHELTTSFRAFRTSMLVDLDFAQVKSQGYTFFLECVWQAARAGFRCAEVPIHFADRLHGRSKIPRLEVVRGIGKLALLASRRLRGWQKWRHSTEEPKGRCPHCDAVYRIEVYPRSKAESNAGVEAYRCTSMEHSSKPQVVRCLVCGLLAAEPSDAEQEALELYRDVEDPTYLLNRPSRERTFGWVLDEMEGWAEKRGRLLEVGAYCGIFLDVSAKKGWRVEGVEPSHWAAGIARENGHAVHTGSLQEVARDLHPPYDVVAMWDVFEHLERPSETLSEIHAELADAGYFFFSTLDCDSRWARLLGRRWQWIMDMHLLYPSIATVENILHANGFELISARPYRHYASVSYLCQKMSQIGPGWSRGILLALAGLTPQWLLIPVYLGDVKLFVCRKALRETPNLSGPSYQVTRT